MTIPKSITFSIDLNKIDESYVTKGKDGARYLDLKMVNTPDNPYGYDYFVSQQLPKAVRTQIKESGGDYPQTPIVGNAKAWEVMGGSSNEGQQQAPVKKQPRSNDDMPF